jgi:hypothetical protein
MRYDFGMRLLPIGEFMVLSCIFTVPTANTMQGSQALYRNGLDRSWSQRRRIPFISSNLYILNLTNNVVFRAMHRMISQKTSDTMTMCTAFLTVDF